jgi:hypothetical protein
VKIKSGSGFESLQTERKQSEEEEKRRFRSLLDWRKNFHLPESTLNKKDRKQNGDGSEETSERKKGTRERERKRPSTILSVSRCANRSRSF